MIKPFDLNQPVKRIEVADVKLCNCAGCGNELLGETTRAVKEEHGILSLPVEYRDTPVVNSRIRGRPYCKSCCLSMMFLDGRRISETKHA